MGSIWILCVLFFSALISGLAVLFIKRDSFSFLKLVLSFSGAYLFGITVLHLLPHVYHAHSEDVHTIGLYVLGGFIFQLLLEQFSQGVEHGHVHIEKGKIAPFPLAILISLCLHGLLEGMPLAGQKQPQLVFGIALHHIPAAFALGSLLLAAKAKRVLLIFCVTLFAVMTPLGFLISKAVSENAIGNISQYFDRMMAVVIGIFLHVSTTILFESGSHDHHVFNRKKMAAVAVGILLSLSSLIFGEHDHGHGTHGDHTHPHDHDQHDGHDHQH